MKRAKGKYSNASIKMATFQSLKCNLPTFIHITKGKYHDVNALEEIVPIAEKIYIFDKAVASWKIEKVTGLHCD